MVNVALIGMGTVGRNLLRIIDENSSYFKESYGVSVKVTSIFEFDGALMNEKGLNLKQIRESKNFRSLAVWRPNLKAIDEIPKLNAHVIIECTPTNPKTGEPALSHILLALKSKKHIISSNKGPFYLKYNEIKELAQANQVTFGFESTVGSAIPCIAAKKTLAGNRIKKIVAILNGTSNYILSRMTEEGINFDLALKEAQELGYAEADPTLDIKGYDAAGKLVILANHLMGWNKTIKDVKISGIDMVNQDLIELAEKDKKVIKHLGIAEDGELEVSLKLLPENSPIAVDGTLNAIMLDTENAGDIVFIGRGAGGSEAAAGIIADLINISQEYHL